MKRELRTIAVAFILVWLLTWSATSFASINICTETADAIANGPYTGGEDITDALNEVISNIDDPAYSDPYIPAGVYYISSTITWPYRAGYSLRGVGAIGETENGAATKAQRTVIRWNGSDDATMFKVLGKHVVFKDFCMNARNQAGTGAAGIGIYFTRDGNTGLATGHTTLERLSIWNFTSYGIQNGSAILEGNCEEIDCHNVDFWDIGTACWYNRGAAQMGIRLNGSRVYGSSPVFFLATGGGKAVFNNPAILTSGVTLLKTTQALGGFGQNNADFVINNPIIDFQARTNFKLIDGDSYNLDVTVNGGVQSITDSENNYDYDGDYVDVKGRSVVRFNGHRSNFANMVGAYQASYGTPVFIFNACGSYGADPRRQITGDYSVRQYGCFNQITGAMYDDYPPRTVSTQSVSTTGAAIAEVTSGYGEQVYGQNQLIAIDVQPILTKYTKTIEDVTEANVTLKFRQGISDALADYDRNSTDDSEVTYAMEDVTVADGSTESHLIVRATVPYGDFGSSGIRANKTYYIGCGLTITGLSGSVEPDSTTNGTVKYVTQRVD